jgi:hypothetical protein
VGAHAAVHADVLGGDGQMSLPIVVLFQGLQVQEDRRAVLPGGPEPRCGVQVLQLARGRSREGTAGRSWACGLEANGDCATALALASKKDKIIKDLYSFAYSRRDHLCAGC